MSLDYSLLIRNAEYEGLTGETAVDEAYHRIFERFDQPRNEADLVMTIINPQGFKNLFGMYFSLHPEEAQKIVDKHHSRHAGWRKLLEPFAYFGNPVRSMRYKTARQQVESTR